MSLFHRSTKTLGQENALHNCNRYHFVRVHSERIHHPSFTACLWFKLQTQHDSDELVQFKQSFKKMI